MSSDLFVFEKYTRLDCKSFLLQNSPINKRALFGAVNGCLENEYCCKTAAFACDLVTYRSPN